MRESEIVKLCVKISNMIYGRDFTHAQSNDSEIMSFTGQRLTVRACIDPIKNGQTI